MRRRVGSPNASVIADTVAVKAALVAMPKLYYPRSANPGGADTMAAVAVTSEQLVEALRPVQDPELHRSIVDLGMVRRAELDPDGTAQILVALTVAGCPLRNEIQNRVRGALATI